MTQEKLTKIFGRFAGMEVPLDGYTVRRGGRVRESYELADPGHPVLKDMEQTAVKNGLKLRVWWPGKFAALMPSDNNRVNAYIGFDKGAWRVTKHFTMG